MNYLNNKLLFDDSPIVVDKKAAVILGLECATVLQQLHYWLRKSNNHKDGKVWVYNTLAGWQENSFPFMSTTSISRRFKELEARGLVITANYNKTKMDKTIWYTIDYEKIEELEKEMSAKSIFQNEKSNPQIEKSIPQSETTIPEITTEITQEEKEKYKKEKNSKSEKHRLPDDWVLSEKNKLYAKELGFDDGYINLLAEGFTDYWHSSDAKNPLKSDWDMTWRNYVRDKKMRGYFPPQVKTYESGSGRITGEDELMRAMGLQQ